MQFTTAISPISTETFYLRIIHFNHCQFVTIAKVNVMHQTASLDYIVILSGEIYLITDTEETLLQAGDIVIQRGTNHAWSNRSDQMCLQLAILIDANKKSTLLLNRQTKHRAD